MSSGSINSKRIKNITIIGMFFAITLILYYTVGTIKVGVISLTIAHIPAIIAGMLCGPLVGLIIGTSLGLFSWIRSFTPAVPLDVLLQNPLVSVLPRMLIGIFAYYAYKLISKFNNKTGVILGAAVGSLTNSVFVLGMLFLIYYEKIKVIATDLGHSTPIYLLFTIIMTNSLAELAASIIIATPIVIAVRKVLKK